MSRVCCLFSEQRDVSQSYTGLMRVEWVAKVTGYRQTSQSVRGERVRLTLGHMPILPVGLASVSVCQLAVRFRRAPPFQRENRSPSTSERHDLMPAAGHELISKDLLPLRNRYGIVTAGY